MSQTPGELIRERRLGMGLSLGQLANRLSTSANEVRRWERNQRVPDAAARAALVAYLDIDPAAFDALALAAEAKAAETAAAETEAAEAVADEADDASPGPGVPGGLTESTDIAESPTELVSAAAGVSLTSVAQPPEAAGVDAETEPSDDGGGAPLGAAPAEETATSLSEPPAVPTDADTPVPVSEVAAAAVPSDAPAPDAPRPRPIPLRYPESVPAGVAVEIAEPAPNPWNPLRYLYDPEKPWLYWVRGALTVLVLLILINILLSSVSELFDKIGALMDTIEPHEPVGGVPGT